MVPTRPDCIPALTETCALCVRVAGRLSRVRVTNGAVTDLGAFPYRLRTVLADGRLAMSAQASLHLWRPPR